MPPESLLATLRHVWLALKPLDIPMAVMGGIALATWKYVRATRDIDLLVATGPGDPERLLGTLAAADIHPKRPSPLVQLGDLQLMQLLYEPPETFVDLQIDLLLGSSNYHLKALERRLPVRLPDLDIEIAVLTCEDLILHKLMAERIIDMADTVALLRANRGSLDLAYLAFWIREMELASPFQQAWHAAWPNEPPPC